MFEASDPDYASRVKQSFDRQRAMSTLGIQIVDLQAGRVKMAMPYSEQYTQQHGFLHAGIISTALDSACGYAAFSLMPADAAILTVEFKTNLIAPADGDEFLFVGDVIKPGRTISVCEAQAFAIRNEKRKLVATMTGTLMAVYGRTGLDH